MLDIVKKAIDQFYIKKDYNSFREKCKESLELLNEIKDYANKFRIRISSSPDTPDDPSRNWYIYFKTYKKGMFEVNYRTILYISKVAPLFNFNHEFKVENKCKDSMDSELGDYSDYPYCEDQAKFQEMVTVSLNSRGYYQLTIAEMEEVIGGFKMPNDVKIFGKNITVDLLLFVDVLNICQR